MIPDPLGESVAFWAGFFVALVSVWVVMLVANAI
jgi:hypothetical protein